MAPSGTKFGLSSVEQALDAGRSVSQIHIDQDNSEAGQKFMSSLNAAIEKQNHSQLVQNLVSEIPFVLKHREEEAAEGYVNSVGILIAQLKDKNSANDRATKSAICSSAVSHITDNVDDRPILRLKLLTSLFNNTPSNRPERLLFFLGFIKFAAASKNLEIVASQARDLSILVQEWGVTDDEASSAMKLLSSLFIEHGMNDYAITHLTSFLATPLAANAVTEAVTLISHCINAPEIYRFDHLFALPAVNKLKDANRPVYKLLCLMTESMYKEVMEWIDAHAKVIDALKLNLDTVRVKMQHLTVTSLASSCNRLPYSVVAEALDIEEAGVEHLVFAVVSAGLLDARLDQLQKTIEITRSTPRMSADWETLHSRLSEWANSIQSLLEVLKGEEDKGRNH